MRFLPASDKKYFEEFYSEKAKSRYISDDVKPLVFRILFGTFLTDHSYKECFQSCNGCQFYNKERCAGMKSRDRWGDGRSQADGNTQYAASDYNYYYHMIQRIERVRNELYLILGNYRVDSFIEWIYFKAYDSVQLHNKLNPKHKKEELKLKDIKYWSSKDIMDTDSWLKFKNVKSDGELLCSLLSDF